ncbi:hypothetical protein MIND_00245800 [Mycena indigotica]|uniref:Uncharacterized protein n=1 Tax=Mycena indigotica TaxID=2126181 RepID=A0A8H6T9B7_9AGAR|nr:uncharacterized protein MIND_00245800 [Mycena indigotica]KAF7312327.1 hypothetical protein MIND_00245800 [Mycena indigotica]
MAHNHPHPRWHNRRDDPFNTPNIAGLNGASINANTLATANSLAINTAAAAANTNQPVVVSFSPTNTVTDPAESSTNSGSNLSGSAEHASSPSISMGTVIGACLGALVGAVVLILIGLWLYKRASQPRRRPSTAHKSADKERAWAKMEDNDDKWEGKENKYQQKGVVSVGPMEKLTMFKTATPSLHTTSNSGETNYIPSVTPFSHPFAQYHPNLAKELAEDNNSDLPEPPRRPFLARVEPIPPISWDGDTARDSFLSLSSNPMSPGFDMAIPTPKLTSSEPHQWQSAEVMNFESESEPRGRDNEPRRKSANNPFFGARMSVHSTHSRSRSQSRSRTPSISAGSRSATVPDVITMPVPPASAYTREEKGKYRAVTPPSPASSRAPSTIIAHDPFSDPITPIVPFKAEHISQGSQDRAMASLLAALGPTATANEIEERLRVASMNPSLISESQYTETDGDALHQSWPVPPSGRDPL